MEIVAAAVAAALVIDSQATRLPLQLPRGETAVDVIFQMSNGGLLAGNHMALSTTRLPSGFLDASFKGAALF